METNTEKPDTPYSFLLKLAKSVLRWEKADLAIAKDGWDGGEREQEWHSAKEDMLKIAHDAYDAETLTHDEKIVKLMAEAGIHWRPQ